eukprot:GHVO01050827.1.p2 GENE.GHVO01050827.1~~GHVO01050827.1.p2  ORF type:complete len:127 (+),score=11.82 GHVO01050827.1:509-889(+)
MPTNLAYSPALSSSAAALPATDKQYMTMNFYHSVQAAPNKQLMSADPRPMAIGPMLGSSIGEPFESNAKVVANCCVGFGDPLTVTVAAEGLVDGWVALAVAEVSRIVNRFEVAYITPGVEFRNRRK